MSEYALVIGTIVVGALVWHAVRKVNNEPAAIETRDMYTSPVDFEQDTILPEASTEAPIDKKHKHKKHDHKHEHKKHGDRHQETEPIDDAVHLQHEEFHPTSDEHISANGTKFTKEEFNLMSTDGGVVPN